MRALANGFARHDLLDVEPRAWTTMLATRPDLADPPYLVDWAERGWPVILRRRHPGEDEGGVPAGLPLPPADGKRRIGLTLPPESVRPREPLMLADRCVDRPAGWAETIEAVLRLGERHGAMPRPFGSLLWQSLTGLPYLSPTSDLDLIWPVAGPVPDGLLDGLAVIDAAAPIRLDGELLFADGGGAQWREVWAAASDDEVLVKFSDRLDLRRASSLKRGYSA